MCNFTGEWKDKAFADKVIAETNSYWKALVSNKDKANELAILNTTQEDSAACISLVNYFLLILFIYIMYHTLVLLAFHD